MMGTARKKPGERSPRERRIESRAKHDERGRCILAVWKLWSALTRVGEGQRDTTRFPSETRDMLLAAILERTVESVRRSTQAKNGGEK